MRTIMRTKPDTIFTDRCIVHFCILAMNMKDLGHPDFQLPDRLYELLHLMRRLPFQSEMIAGNRIKHHFPGSGAKSYITGGSVPMSIHMGVLDSDLHMMKFSRLYQFREMMHVPIFILSSFICQIFFTGCLITVFNLSGATRLASLK